MQRFLALCLVLAFVVVRLLYNALCRLPVVGRESKERSKPEPQQLE